MTGTMTKEYDDEHEEFEGYYHVFTAGEIRERIIKGLQAVAADYDLQSKVEDTKKAANQNKVVMLDWGATQVRELTDTITNLPGGEIRQRFIPASPNIDPEVVNTTGSMNSTINC